LESAALAGDFPAAGRTAHSLMGSAANFGAARLVAACRRLEEAAGRGEAGNLVEAASNIRSQFDSVRDGLLRACSTGRAAS
jgi:HPt (histidine-containing phosphotransfer) domain-containing protein